MSWNNQGDKADNVFGLLGHDQKVRGQVGEGKTICFYDSRVNVGYWRSENWIVFHENTWEKITDNPLGSASPLGHRSWRGLGSILPRNGSRPLSEGLPGPAANSASLWSILGVQY